MSAQIIPRSQWTEFLRWFSAGHRHWLVTAHWRQRLASLQLLVQNGLFEGLSVSLAAPQVIDSPDADRLWLDFARDLRQIPRHELMALAGMRYFHEDEGDRLELEAGDGAVLSLSLRPAQTEDERLPAN